ncbi:MAG: Transcriptional regulator, partial [Paenibacillus sp.]|nr:Transcriptional regulator [Paenibacillus sp.]
MKFDNSFLYLKIKRHLSEEIAKRALDGQEIRLDSERDMAEALNVSRFSVNKAISELVTEGYLIKRRGKGVFIPPREQLASLEQQANTIVLIVPDSSVYYYGEIIWEIENIAFEHQYNIVLSLNGGDPDKERSVLNGILNKSQPIKGIIAAPHLDDSNASLYRKLQAAGIPVVLIARVHASMEDLPHIVYDQGEGVYEGAKLLSGQGRKRILFIGDHPTSYLSRMRQDGLKRIDANVGVDCSELFQTDPDFNEKLIQIIRERR